MTDHPETLSAFADGELSAEQAAVVRQHINQCLPCAASLVDTWLLKSSIAKSGRRYALPNEAEERLRNSIAKQPSPARPLSLRTRQNWIGISGWIAAAAMLFVLLGWALLQFQAGRTSASAELAAEASDLHIAMLASGGAPQVVSSDRHTVKPWYQGKLPFSFNLPDALPADTRLDGGNLVYIGDRPVAQLLFSIGRHRASVFVEQKKGRAQTINMNHAGFRVVALESGDLEFVAVSDAEPGRVQALATALRGAQMQP